jgi:hypothetical protein
MLLLDDFLVKFFLDRLIPDHRVESSKTSLSVRCGRLVYGSKNNREIHNINCMLKVIYMYIYYIDDVMVYVLTIIGIYCFSTKHAP